MTASDLHAALAPVVQVFEDLGLAYYVGGSVASSTHGVPRASIDADVVVDLDPAHVGMLVQRLEGAYYIDEGRVRDAVRSRRSFNAIHLETMFKVDVFVSKGRPYDREAMRRARTETLDDLSGTRPYRVASAEDTVLAKLEWFRAGGEVSDRQWGDIVGVLKTGGGLDGTYLDQWASVLGVADLLARARRELP